MVIPGDIPQVVRCSPHPHPTPPLYTTTTTITTCALSLDLLLVPLLKHHSFTHLLTHSLTLSTYPLPTPSGPEYVDVPGLAVGYTPYHINTHSLTHSPYQPYLPTYPLPTPSGPEYVDVPGLAVGGTYVPPRTSARMPPSPGFGAYARSAHPPPSIPPTPYPGILPLTPLFTQ